MPPKDPSEPQPLPFVVAIFARLESGTLQFLGTGTAMDKSLVLTCKHVVQHSESLDNEPELRSSLVVLTVDGSDTDVIDGALDPRLDLAVLLLKSPLAVEPVAFATGLDQSFVDHLGSLDLRVVGFPATSQGKQQSTFSSLKFTLTKASSAGGLLQTLQLHGGIDEGCSGGPALVQSSGTLQCFGIAELGGSAAASSRVICADAIFGSALVAGVPDHHTRHHSIDLQRLKQRRTPPPPARSRNYGLMLLIAFGVLLVIATISYLLSVNAPSAIAPTSSTVPSELAICLDSLELIIFQRVKGTPPAGTSAFPTQPISYQMIESGDEKNLQEIVPLRIGVDSIESGADQFRLEGKFSRPTKWALIYVDAQGDVTAPAISITDAQRFVFPAPAHDAVTNADIPQMIPFSEKEEPGIHCLFLAAVSETTTEAALIDSLKRVGRPPQDLNGRWAFNVRDFGRTRDAQSPQEKYVQELKLKLPIGMQPLYALFLRTRLL